jgi:hypothetical protein
MRGAAESRALTPGSRRLVLLAVVLGSLALVLSLGPQPQDTGYHRFADQRAVLGVPNFFDVASNIAFLLAGGAGVAFLARRPAGAAWLVFFIGVAAVSVGSAYYHADPNNVTLVWDRLPITIASMGLFAAILGDYLGERLGEILLAPVVLLGFLSVLYWHWFDDLRFYYWVQLAPLLTIPVAMALFRSRYTHQWVLLAAVAVYALAKIAEAFDGEILALTRHLVSGHTLKHLIAALSCYTVLVFLKRRKASP